MMMCMAAIVGQRNGDTMGIRFRKSIKLFPGVRLNLSGGRISTTIGVPGASEPVLKAYAP
jgi:hypothetical protein